MNECIFCKIVDSDIVLSSKYSLAFYDKFPVNKGHLIIISRRHTSNYFDLPQIEKSDIWELVDKASELLKEKLSPTGFNIGINVNKSAGQTIHHVHIHLIPRFDNDVDDPTGGVRGVILSKQKYWILFLKSEDLNKL